MSLLCIFQINVQTHNLQPITHNSLDVQTHNPQPIAHNNSNAQTHNLQPITRNNSNAQTHNPQLITRNSLLEIARSQLYVRETDRSNAGKEIKLYLAYTGLAEGNPYCAAFVSWVYFKAGYSQPRTAWSPALFPVARQILTPKPADVLGIYSSKLKRIAHCGLVERMQNDWVISIEANTNIEGSREGDGVYRKWRHKRTISKFARWAKL